MNIQDHVTAAMSALRTRRGTIRKRPAHHLRRALEQFGPVGPFGDGDAKTAAPGTYRPVGPSCPPECPALNRYCYAHLGNVGMHQRRSATQETEAHVRAAIAVMVWARTTGKVARLHVSGDFGSPRPDTHYMGLLAAALDEIGTRIPGEGPIAWTYTAHTPDHTEILHFIRLSCLGLHIRWSNKVGYNGAIVARFEDVPRLRLETGKRILKCPAQLTDTTCADCKLCWTHPGHTVAFHPHGTWRNRV